MQKKLLPEAEQMLKQNTRRRGWRKVVQVMACIVVFCTTYALILPAITMEKVCELPEHAHSESCYAQVTVHQETKLACTYETIGVHVHSEDCYDEAETLICGLADFVVHEHGESCLDADGNLVCQLPEVKLHEHTREDCYQVVQTEAEHIHEEACYRFVRGELLCEIPESEGHAHGDACYSLSETPICGLEEVEGHTHDEACTLRTLICQESTEKAHVHEAGCYETRQICGQEESEAYSYVVEHEETVLVCENTEEGHAHEDGCYQTNVTEETIYVDGHSHSEGCYEDALICGQSTEVHVHGEGCYEVSHTCGLEEREGHAHSRECYEATLICQTQEAEGHTHGDDCYELLAELICEPEESTEPEYELVCEEEEILLHSHVDSCYEIYTDETGAEQKKLICSQRVVEEHIHGEGCFETEEIPVDTENLTCTETETHVHSETCYDEAGELICTEPTEGHVHGAMCYGTWELTCGLEEHVHDAVCTPILGLSEEDRLAVENVIALIEPLPTYDEMMVKLDEFYEADDAEGEEAYMTEVYTQVEEAYRAYMALSEEHREYVTNADKLMELEFIWSRITLEEPVTYDASARDDDVNVVSGGGISFKLFNYKNDLINKTSDGTKWRPISTYFNFRDSRAAHGNDPTKYNTTHVQNPEHDIDGFTAKHATVERKLVNGNPILDLSRNADGTARTDPGLSQAERSLAYLFTAGDYAVEAYNPTNTILSKDGNHYTYNSRYNAVDYDVENNLFRVRKYKEVNEVTAGLAGDYGDFLPFTYTGGEAVGNNSSTNTDYHTAYNNDNYWFGMTMDVNFFQTKDGQIDGGDMIFKFSGDDDVWVFVDDVLVLDLGGTHGTVNGSINFATGEILQYLSWEGKNSTEKERTEGSTTSFPTTIKKCFEAAGATPNGGWSEDGQTFANYTEHTLKFFYMERGAAVANCMLDFRLPTLPDKSLTVTKDLVADGNDEVKEFLMDTLSYQFRVVKADSEGNATDNLFIKPGTTFTVLDGGTSAGTGTVDVNGYFSLKPGQSAQFTDMLSKSGGSVGYIVQEIVPEDLTGQYGEIEYEVTGTVGSIKTESDAEQDFVAYSTGKLSAESTQTVTYRNKVDTSELSVLKLTKALAEGAEFDDGKTFQIQVELGGELLPVGTEYQIDETVKTVNTAGVIELEVGQTAKILKGILSGTQYEITELDTATGGFNASYSGTVTLKDNTTEEVSCTADGAAGEFPLNSTVHVTVTNANYDFSGEIPIYKRAIDNVETATFRFLVERVEQEDGNWVVKEQLPGTSITVSDDEKYSGTVTIGYEANAEGSFYYKIREQRGVGSYIYDDSYYIVQVEVSKSGTDGKGTVTLETIWKNGNEEVSEILFTNQKTTRLMVTKEVTGVRNTDSFDFVAEVTLHGEPFNLPSGTGYTVEGNKALFQIAHGGAISISGIPYNAVVTVTEMQHDGFVAYYRVDGVHTEEMLGDSVTVTFGSAMQTVNFINDSGYELPQTGGTGTYLYTMGGLLLMAAAILLYSHTQRRRKEETPSF